MLSWLATIFSMEPAAYAAFQKLQANPIVQELEAAGAQWFVHTLTPGGSVSVEPISTVTPASAAAAKKSENA